jgi:glycosyltransferase involved in cell wall biosynthesis
VRILHLVSCRGWSSDAYWAARVAVELERRGHDVVVGGRASAGKVLDRIRAEGVARVATFAFASGAHPADLADVRRLRAALGAADVVHVHRGKEHWLAAVAARLAGVRTPIVRTRHIAHPVRAHALNRWLYRRATALVVAVSEAIRGQYLAAGLLEPAAVVTLRGGADAERYRPRPADAAMRRTLGGEPDRPLIGLISGFRVMKGHGVLIEAAARLARAGVRPRFVLIGRGPFEDAVRAEVEKAGLASAVTFAGYVDDVPAAMAALDVGLYVPLESEGMSRVAFEYLAAGRPLVASRVGAVAEALTDGRDAVLVPAGDAPALADAIAGLLADPARAAGLGEAGRRLLVDRYSGARVAETLEAIYTRLAA